MTTTQRQKIRSSVLGAGILSMMSGVAMLSVLSFSPVGAEAWWPWHDNGNKVTVTVQKYIDGSKATTESAGGAAFAMSSSWHEPGEDAGSGTFDLSSSGSYEAKTSKMKVGSDYSVQEHLDGDVVGASCEDGKPYALVGYSHGTTTAHAAAMTPGTSASLTGISENQHVIVWNETCDPNEETDPSGDLNGEVTGGVDEQGPGELAITSIDAEKTTATANGEFSDGWQYVFNVTIPTNESNVSMKFANWLNDDNSSYSLPVAGNMRISSAQADNDGETITLNAADTYSSPALTMTEDLDPDTEGLQVQILVEVAVPSDTYNGTYSTSYGIQTTE